MTTTTEHGDRSGKNDSEERFESWRELISLTRECRASTPHVDDFTADLRRLELGPVTFLGTSFPSTRFRRSAAQVRGSDLSVFHITLLLDGGLGVTLPDGSGFTSGPGEFSLLDSSRPYDLRAFGSAGPGRPRVRALGLDFPSALLPVPPDRLRGLLGRRPGGSGTSRLVADFLHHLDRQADTLGPASADRLGPILVDLVSAWLAEELEASDHLSPETRGRALVQNVRAFVQRNLHDPELTPAVIAEAHHVSLSHLHRVFTEGNDGEPLAAWIRRRRLERAHRDLADPALHGTPIHVLAVRCGIPRPDDFSRAFRAAYGMSPREHRHQARTGAGRTQRQPGVDAPPTPGGGGSLT
ncbi:helix-turn-helix domain-containing protein [Kitasatospora sp. NA04385]|uniref:AraC-like ligand-binding domain-containing protein n=1 Tax=Kitasatospora sp. NA04385 TaxID=2742135 RepID=UPI001590BB2F|nr:helix-turn-helix domain-containing protein [Kitasatospora sp. NA04385]QKW22770.1 helix-turn-helix domain-containing protein [Kitasatospora sp. NA04385]